MAIVIHPSQIYEINYTENTVPLRGVKYSKLDFSNETTYSFYTSIATTCNKDTEGNEIENQVELSDSVLKDILLEKNRTSNTDNSGRNGIVPDSIEVQTYKIAEDGTKRWRWATFKYTIDLGGSKITSVRSPRAHMPYFTSDIVELELSSVARTEALEKGDNIFYDAVGSDFPKYNFEDEGQPDGNIFGNVAFSVDDSGRCTIYVKTRILSEVSYYNVNYSLFIDFDYIGKQEATIEGGRGEEYFDFREFDRTSAQEALATEIMADRRLPKPTVKLLCGLDEYYDENGNLVVSHEDSTKPMLIAVGSIVIPYKQTVMGEAPIARDIGYTPKKFYVYNSRFVLQGAPFQELSLVGI